MNTSTIPCPDNAAAVTICDECQFELWLPIGSLCISTLGLYDDARFPGRCILALNRHFASLIDLPQDMATSFMHDIQSACAAVQKATGAARVNVSILGNRDPHVHAHLIPRYPLTETYPRDSPWKDERAKSPLSDDMRDQLIEAVRNVLPEK